MYGVWEFCSTQCSLGVCLSLCLCVCACMCVCVSVSVREFDSILLPLNIN